MPGPDPRLTPAVHERIVQMLATGCAAEVAAEAGGVSGRTVRRWLQHGREACERRAAGDRLGGREHTYAALVDAAGEARARAEVRALGVIHRAAADGSWQAAAWYL